MFPSIVKILLVIDTSVISGVGTEVPNKFPKKLTIQLKGLLDLVGFGEKDFVGVVLASGPRREGEVGFFVGG